MPPVETPTDRPAALERGRAAFESSAWREAYALLAAADRELPLAARDLERLATVARLTGRDAECLDLWARAHQAWLVAGDRERAAGVAAAIAIQFLLAGEHARSGGWVSRARRLLEEGERDCVARGYLLLQQALEATFGGDQNASRTLFAEASALGERLADRDLATLGRMGEGRSLIRQGETARGMALLDEVMVACTAGELSPHVVGEVYCAVVDACHETYDIRRAQEWTAALLGWTASQPEISPYRGACRIHRAELLQLQGQWPEALEEAARACDGLAGPPAHRALGAAWYRLAELHRLQGEATEAEELYRKGSRWGREPQPGLALLRLAQGRVEAAATAIRRVIAEATNPRQRAADLAAGVEILLAAGGRDAARTAAAELSRLAAGSQAPFLRALSDQATGAVLLADDDHAAAIAALRRAARDWSELRAPYETAQVRAMLGLAHRAMGDEDTAAVELDAASHAFAALGAEPDRRRVEALLRPAPSAGVRALTPREVEVLRLVATGGTNRAIAQRLRISEKTVARHLSNIFTKLDLSTRAAATAYAYQRGLVSAPT